MNFAGDPAATAFVRDIARSIATERPRFAGMPTQIITRIQHILRVEIDAMKAAQHFTPGRIYARERISICGVQCYIVADLPEPGWRVINPLYDDTADLAGGEEGTNGADSAIND